MVFGGNPGTAVDSVVCTHEEAFESVSSHRNMCFTVKLSILGELHSPSLCVKFSFVIHAYRFVLFSLDPSIC